MPLSPETDDTQAQRAQEPVTTPTWALGWLLVLEAALFVVSLYSYPLFHTFAELFGLIVTAALFMVIVQMRRLLDNHYLLLVGVGSLFVAAFGIPHMLAYSGVQVIHGFGNDLPTQAFMAQRVVLVATFLIAPLFLTRRLRLAPTFGVFTACTVLPLLSMMLWRNFPVMFAEGIGPTVLKRSMDMGLAALMIVAAWMLWRRRASFDPNVARALLAALASFTISDVFFAMYSEPFSALNLTGHLFQVAGFYLIYRAVLVTALVNPYAILFRELTFRERESERLFRAEVSRAERMAALKDIAELGVSSLEVNELAVRLAATLPTVLRADRVLLTMESDSEGVYVPVGSHGWSGDELAQMTPVPQDSPILDAYRTGTMALIEDSRLEAVPALMRERSSRFGARAVAVAPLKSGSRTIGTISVGWLEPRRFGDDEVAFLESVAAETAVALQSAVLFDAERTARFRAAAELETTRLLLEAARAVSSSIDLDEVLHGFANVALRYTGLTRAFVNLVDMDTRLLTPVVATEGLVAPAGRTIPFASLSQTSVAAFESKRSVLLDYEQPDIPEGDAGIARANNCRLALFVPLLVGGKIVGHATFDEPGKRHDFTPREIEVLEGIATQVALVVRNAQLYDAAQRHAELERSLAEAAGMLASSLDSESAWPDVLELASEALDATSALLLIREASVWRVAAVRSLSGELLQAVTDEADLPSLATMVRTRESVLLADVDDADPAVAEWAHGLGCRSFIMCPVLGHGEVIAAVSLCFAEPRPHMSDDELHVVSRIAFMVGVAEENARLYRREHEIAETLQEGLLAMPSELPGVEFARAYRSATLGSRVGGDFYDVFQLGQEHIGITVGDVSGKGLGAAVTTSLVKNTIRAHATERGKSPARVLSLTNDVVYRATPPETFVTVFFAILDCRDGRLVYSNAAHTTAGIVHADGAVGELGVTGPLLGAFPAVNFGEAEAVLDAEDLLFMYTDGLTEARCEGKLYGEPRLMTLLSTLSGRTPREAVDAVVADAEAYSGNRLMDDLAILAIRRETTDSPALGQTKLIV